jgi:signal transduction histidine kinase/ActR/RegA family two-component response regulator
MLISAFSPSARPRRAVHLLNPTGFYCWLCLLLSLLVTAVASPLVLAQGLDKQKITASYLYNFAKNIEWPNESGMSSFAIGIYGIENPQLLAELRLLANNVKLRNLPITVSQVNTVKSLTSYQLIFLEQASQKTLTEIYEVLDGNPILLVTAEQTNQQLVMINLITTNQDRLRFEVNRSNIINQGLNPLPELILNGGTEIDVARLYREGQASLVTLQKQLQSRENALGELANEIAKQEALNARLEQQLAELNSNIEKSDQLILQQKNQIGEQLGQIAVQAEQIDTSKKERLELLREVELRTKELDEQQRLLNSIVQEIDTREQRLAFLNNTISSQEVEILKQQEAIAGLDETVGSQQTALRYLWGSVSLGVLLLITIFIAYTVKRRDNQILAAHSQDLQIAKDRLAIAKRKAEDASQAKSEFLSLMSHELRTPLQAIIGYTEVVIEELRAEDDQAHIDDLTRVISNSERLLKLINGVLDLAKIESGRMQLDLTEVKLSSLVDEALGTLGPLFEKNAIQLNVEVDDGAYLPVADPEKILHILINLLGNTCKYAPNSVVTVKALHEPQRIYLSVADTGIGLSPEQQLQIFEPFTQADSGTTRKFQGSGLGLSITRQLCEMMGGSISVDSQLGIGSIFMVDLPLPIDITHLSGVAGSVDGDAGVAPDNAEMEANGQHIVMIDDDPAFLDIMARTMRSEGFHVHTAGDAETGLRLLQAVKPQLITLDLLLPDEHGWHLFEKIKADPDLQDIPVIVISIMDERKYDLRRQAEDYLTKPIRRETLKLAIQRLVAVKE